MKVYQCYNTYPAESADVTVYVRECPFDYTKVLVEYFPKDPLAEPFKKQLAESFVEADSLAEQYISKKGFEKVIVRA